MEDTQVSENSTLIDSRIEKHPGGRPAWDSVSSEAFSLKPLESKREILNTKWAQIAYEALSVAERSSRSIAKKDWGKLVQLLTAAGISYDKVWPKAVGPVLQFNLFKGLDQGRLQRVVGIDLASEQPGTTFALEQQSGMENANALTMPQA